MICAVIVRVNRSDGKGFEYNDALQARLWEVNATLRTCALRQPQIQRRVSLLRERIDGLEEEIDEIMMEKITVSKGRQ